MACPVSITTSVTPVSKWLKLHAPQTLLPKAFWTFHVVRNGQTAPAKKRLFESLQDDATSATPPATLTLQAFFEALLEPVDDKTVAEVNAPGSLNPLIQSAPGGKFEHRLIWTTDAKLGIYDPCIAHQLFPWISHSAVLRLTRPGEVRTYLIVPQFPNRADANNAVCLAALATGVGAYVRAINAALEAKISPETMTLSCL